MTRRLDDWLQAFLRYKEPTEAPRQTHFWAGVSTLAGALRRKVWFDQYYFQWYPSFYIIFVGPPGVITKSTTADATLEMLNAITGIHFGPDEVTWQSLVSSFAAAGEQFLVGDTMYPMSALTLVSSEFGLLMDFQDKKMVNLFITLWDGRKKFEKQTKTSGNDVVEAPWINMLACTTPQWIAENMSQSTIGGGFTSRCIFVYGDKKDKRIANIKKFIRENGTTLDEMSKLRDDLIHDLEHISMNLAGEYCLAPDAEDYYDMWYENLWDTGYTPDKSDFENGQVARRQTHLTKLAMILAASQRDELVITLEDLQVANRLLEEVNKEASKVFSKIGRTEESLNTEKMLDIVRRKGRISLKDTHRAVFTLFGDVKDFDGILKGAIQAGYIRLEMAGDGPMLVWVGDGTHATTAG